MVVLLHFEHDEEQQKFVGTCSGPPAPTPAPVPTPAPTPAPTPKVAGAGMFCFMAELPGSFEVELRKEAEARGTSIFACDVYKVYQSYPVGFTNSGFSNNIMPFKKIWEHIWDDGLYKTQDWTVKVDPDCVWSPQRLRQRLPSYNVKRGDRYYIKNGFGAWGFLGPIEILTVAAVEKLSEVAPEHCNYSPQGGEDGWLKVCCEQVAGFGPIRDHHLLMNNNDVGSCSDGSWVAYHHFKSKWSWSACADRMLR